MKVEKILDGASGVLSTIGSLLLIVGVLFVISAVYPDSDSAPISGTYVFVVFLLGLAGGVSCTLASVLRGASENSEDEDEGKVSEQQVEKSQKEG